MRSSASGLHVTLLACLAGLILMSLRFGAVPANWSDVFEIFAAAPGPEGRAILELRLPRTACAVLIGAYLGLAGLVFQTVLRNPLADPTLFGISGGASLAVVAAMGIATALFPLNASYGASAAILPTDLVPPIALAGGLTATALVVWLAWQDGLSPLRLVLFGAVFAFVLNGIVMVMVMSLAESRTELAILWLAGSLYARDFANFWPAVPWGVGGIAVIVAAFPWLSGLRFDAQTAQGMGVSTRLATPILLAAAAGLAASSVSVAGPVGFVGLLVPHMVRLIYGAALGPMAGGAAILGACLVVASDLVGRVIAPPIEIPVGIVTSLIGAPIFALLIRREIRRQSA
ncbi:MAG: iron ABC transporter permease [Pseudomonadota bacterium]